MCSVLILHMPEAPNDDLSTNRDITMVMCCLVCGFMEIIGSQCLLNSFQGFLLFRSFF